MSCSGAQCLGCGTGTTASRRCSGVGQSGDSPGCSAVVSGTISVQWLGGAPPSHLLHLHLRGYQQYAAVEWSRAERGGSNVSRGYAGGKKGLLPCPAVRKGSGRGGSISRPGYQGGTAKEPRRLSGRAHGLTLARGSGKGVSQCPAGREQRGLCGCAALGALWSRHGPDGPGRWDGPKLRAGKRELGRVA